MEILKRAKEFQSGEGVSWTESESNVREEVNRRTAKAGYTTKYGEPTISGRGDVFRPVDKKKYDKEYERIFRHN